MHDNDISRVPVVEDGRLVGIIARGDILRAIITPDARRSPGGASDLGRGRPRRGRPQHRPCSSTTSRPAEVWAVVKADGYGHGAVPVARAAARGRRRAGWPSRWSRRRSSCATPGSTPRSCSSPSPAPRSSSRWRPSTCGPPSTRGRGIEAAAAVDRRAAGPPEGRHRHAPRRRRTPTTSCALARAIADAPEPGARGGLDPLRGGRRTGTPVHRRAARPLRRRAGRPRGRGHRGAADPRRQLGRRARPPARPGARSCGPASRSTASTRHPELAGCLPAAPGDAAAVRGHDGQAGRRRRGHLLRPAPHLRPRRPRSPRCPSGTPTASPAASASSARRCWSAGAGGRSSASSPWTS